jgi:ABC-type oligopeptide transport system substrate-binding subunit
MVGRFLSKGVSMKQIKIISVLMLIGFLVACNTAEETPTIADAVTEIAMATATETTVPAPTNTPVPPTPTEVVIVNTPTPFPGELVYPIDIMEDSDPWLPNNSQGRPFSVFFGLNMNQAPFQSLLVRKAFSAATDRVALSHFASELYFEKVTPATSLVAPLILGRDLYEEVGISYDPEQAKLYMEEAGYTDMTNFPVITLVTSFVTLEDNPGAFLRMANALEEMWEKNLGIRVEVKNYNTVGQYYAYLGDFPTGYDVYRMLYSAKLNGPGLDPSDLLDIFVSDHDFNYSSFYSAEYDRVMELAENAGTAEERMGYFIEAERILTEELAIVIPIFHAIFP